MKVVNFPNITTASDEQINCLLHSPHDDKTNGLYDVLYKGYSYHIPIVLRPDDILNNIASLWAKYVIINAERFRSQFVEHEGQKKLVYVSGGSYSDERMSEFMDGLIQLIVEDQSDDKVLWAVSQNFSTTTDSDQFVRATATLASQKEYYEYGCMLMCGLPKITLEGTEEDWADLLSCIDAMPSLEDSDLQQWKQDLKTLIENITSNESEEFWQTLVTHEPFGSGPQTIEGWITTFNPFNEGGHWCKTLDKSDILDLSTDFDLDVNDNGKKFKLNISAGPSSSRLHDATLSVLNEQSIALI